MELKLQLRQPKNFYDKHKRFYALLNGNKVVFYSLDGELVLETSEIQEIMRSMSGRYVRIQTANSTYNLWAEFDAPSHDIRKLTIELGATYPMEYNYNSRCALFQCALKDNTITCEEFEEAAKYYGELWNHMDN